MNIWFLSDWHIGHKNMVTRWRTQFSSIEEHDAYFFDHYDANVNKNDHVYLLGDLAYNLSFVSEYKRMPGKKILVAGNHDTDRGKSIPALMANAGISEVHGCVKYKEFWLTHIPM